MFKIITAALAAAIATAGAVLADMGHQLNDRLMVLMHRQGLLLTGYKMELSDLQNVTPGNTAVLRLPAGPNSPTYDNIRLTLSGGMLPSHIEFVRGKIDGRIFLDEGTGSEIQDRDDYRGIFTENGFVNLDFTETKARNGAAEQLVASVPGHLCKSLVFEIKIAAAAPALGRIAASADYRPPTSNPFVRKLHAMSQAFSAAGTEGAPNVLYLPTGEAQGAKVKRIWLKETTAGNITAVQIRIANNNIHTATRTALENSAKRNGLVPQAGLCVLDFIEDGNLAGLLDTQAAPHAELRLVTTAGELVKAYIETLDPIGHL